MEQVSFHSGLNSIIKLVYKGAMYHTQGRGFTGFREIIEKDVRRNIVTRSQFEQKFPQVGLLTEQETKVGYDIIRRTVNEWKDNPTHSVSGVAHQFLKQTTLDTWDINGTHMMHQVSLQPSDYDIDQYGNVKKKRVTTTDYIDGQQNTDTVETITAYTPSASSWWLNKVTSKTSKTFAMSRGWSDDPIKGLNSGKSSPDANRTIKVTFSNWDNTHKKPKTSTTTATDVTCKLIKTAAFNTYGLPSSVTVKSDSGTGTGKGCSGATNRTTSFNYTKNGTGNASDGYLPYAVTNAKGHSSTTQYDIGFGKPTRVVTKITSSSELVSTTKLDAIGRPIEVSATAQPTQYLRYMLASDGDHKPARAKTLMQTKAMGAPTTELYLDSLGRKLRVATQGFAGEYRYADKIYDFQGRLIKESLPYFSTGLPVYTEYGEFDALERPKWRKLPHGLESRYFYDGLKTEITVNGNRSMSRTYNSRKWLLETQDAKDGTNRFSYDASGRPLIIEDAKGKQILAYYNDFGHKYKVDDPNNGITEFKYNTFGELTWQKDANGVQQTNKYDALGRAYERSITGGNNPHTASYSWDTRKYGMLSAETANGITRNYY